MIVTKIVSLILLQCVMSQEPYIYKGNQAKEQQFPFMAFIYYEYFTDIGDHTCSACLITPKKVLTAAHCFPKKPIPKQVNVTAGVVDLKYVYEGYDVGYHKTSKPTGLQIRTGEQVIIHSQFDPSSMEHDLAVVVVQPFELNKYVQAIKPSTDEVSQTTNCTILGFGATENNKDNTKLIYANDVHVTTVAKGCPAITHGTFYCIIREGSSSTICIGDSGSPLVCNGMACGVASWGKGKIKPKRFSNDSFKCGEGMDFAYINLSEDKEFVETYLRDGSASLQPFFNTSGIKLIIYVIVTFHSIVNTKL